MGVVIEDLSAAHWTKTNPVADYSTNGYPTRIPTLTMPSGDGIIAFGQAGAIASKKLLLIPIGKGSSTNTFGMQILGWRMTRNNVQQNYPVWVPVTIATYAVTLGSETGLANSDLIATYLMATTITCTYGPTFITAQLPTILDWFILSPGSNAIGMISQPAFGFRMLEVIYTTGGVATSCNALYCKG